MNAIALPSTLSDELPEIFRLTEVEQFELLENFYPGASPATKKMLIAYCRGMRIDPVLKPVHVVPMKVKTGKKAKARNGNEYDETAMKDVLMPGIGLYRIQAARTGTYAGKDKPVFGPVVRWEFKRAEWKDGSKTMVDDFVEYPEWCEITVYKLVGGARCPYTVQEFWLENVAITQDAPNSMWSKRPHGQIAKCAEAQALRMAYPEVGSMPTYEEMMGRKFLDPEDVDHGNGDHEPPARQEPKRKSAQPALENNPGQTIEGQLLDNEPQKVGSYGPEERREQLTQTGAAVYSADPDVKASPGEISHVKGKFGDRLDEACEKAGLSVRADTIDNLSKDGFTALLDVKREWKL